MEKLYYPFDCFNVFTHSPSNEQQRKCLTNLAVPSLSFVSVFKWVCEYHFTVCSTTLLMSCNSVLSHTPCWVLGLCLWCQVLLLSMRRQYPTETFGTTHNFGLLQFSYFLSLFLTLLACENGGQHRAWKGLSFWCRGAPCTSVCLWWGKYGGVRVTGGAWQHKDPLWSHWKGA